MLWVLGLVVLVLALVVGAGLVVWPVSPTESPPSPAPSRATDRVVVPEGADVVEHEREAEALFNEAVRKAAPGSWEEAKAALDRLETDFAATSFYAVNRSSIAQLRAKIAEALGLARPEAEGQSAADAPRDAVAAYARWVRRLRGSWAQRRFDSALVGAEALAKDEQLADHPEAAKWLVEDARLLLEAWRTVKRGAASLQPGTPVRIEGAEAQVETSGEGTLVVRRGGARAEYPLTRLATEDLVPLFRLARPQEASGDHLAFALLWLHSSKPDLAKAAAELDAADSAGLDVARHRAVLEALGGPKSQPERRQGRYPTFSGEPLVLEAESAPMRARPMRVQPDESASGGAFVWEPRQRGQDRVGDGSGRIVFYVRSDQAREALLWARVRAPNNDTNSFYLAVVPGRQTRAEARAWHFAAKDDWVWSAFDATSGPDRGSRRPTHLPLQPGLNSIIISVRERGTALDTIRITAP